MRMDFEAEVTNPSQVSHICVSVAGGVGVCRIHQAIIQKLISQIVFSNTSCEIYHE